MSPTTVASTGSGSGADTDGGSSSSLLIGLLVAAIAGWALAAVAWKRRQQKGQAPKRMGGGSRQGEHNVTTNRAFLGGNAEPRRSGGVPRVVAPGEDANDSNGNGRLAVGAVGEARSKSKSSSKSGTSHHSEHSVNASFLGHLDGEVYPQATTNDAPVVGDDYECIELGSAATAAADNHTYEYDVAAAAKAKQGRRAANNPNHDLRGEQHEYAAVEYATQLDGQPTSEEYAAVDYGPDQPASGAAYLAPTPTGEPAVYLAPTDNPAAYLAPADGQPEYAAVDYGATEPHSQTYATAADLRTTAVVQPEYAAVDYGATQPDSQTYAAVNYSKDAVVSPLQAAYLAPTPGSQSQEPSYHSPDVGASTYNKPRAAGNTHGHRDPVALATGGGGGNGGGGLSPSNVHQTGDDDYDDMYGVVMSAESSPARTTEAAPAALDSNTANNNYGITAELYPVAQVAQVAYVAPTPTYAAVDYSKAELSTVVVSSNYDTLLRTPVVVSSNDDTLLRTTLRDNTAGGAATAIVDEAYQPAAVHFDGDGVEYDYEAMHFQANGAYDYGIPSQIMASSGSKAERAVPAETESMYSSYDVPGLNAHGAAQGQSGLMVTESTYAGLYEPHATYVDHVTTTRDRDLSNEPITPAADGTHANTQATASGQVLTSQTQTSVTDTQTTATTVALTSQTVTSVADNQTAATEVTLTSPAQSVTSVSDDDFDPTYDYAARSGPDVKIVLGGALRRLTEETSIVDVDQVDSQIETLRRPDEDDPDFVATTHNVVAQGTCSGDKWTPKKKKTKPKLDGMGGGLNGPSGVAAEVNAAIGDDEKVMVWDPRRQRQSFKDW